MQSSPRLSRLIESGARGEIRTPTELILSQSPLPIGPHAQGL